MNSVNRSVAGAVIFFALAMTCLAAFSAPYGLTATPSSSAISVKWSQSGNVSGLYLERGQGGSFSRIATLSSSARSYQDSGLSPSTTYSYRVRSYKGGQVSPYSAIVSATTQPAAPPPPPPSCGTAVAGVINVSADTTGGIAVQFYMGGTPIGINHTAPPFVQPIDTTAVVNGCYDLQASANDSAGVVGWSNKIAIQVQH